MSYEIEKLKFEKAWACRMLANIRDALKDGRKLSAKTKMAGDESGLLDAIDYVLDSVAANALMAEVEPKLGGVKSIK